MAFLSSLAHHAYSLILLLIFLIFVHLNVFYRNNISDKIKLNGTSVFALGNLFFGLKSVKAG